MSLSLSGSWIWCITTSAPIIHMISKSFFRTSNRFASCVHKSLRQRSSIVKNLMPQSITGGNWGPRSSLLDPFISSFYNDPFFQNNLNLFEEKDIFLDVKETAKEYEVHLSHFYLLLPLFVLCVYIITVNVSIN